MYLKPLPTFWHSYSNWVYSFFSSCWLGLLAGDRGSQSQKPRVDQSTSSSSRQNVCRSSWQLPLIGWQVSLPCLRAPDAAQYCPRFCRTERYHRARMYPTSRGRCLSGHVENRCGRQYCVTRARVRDCCHDRMRALFAGWQAMLLVPAGQAMLWYYESILLGFLFKYL